MSRTDQLKALICSHADGDDDRFFAVALQVAAQAARQGHTKLAQELRELIEHGRDRSLSVPRQKPVPLVQPRGELSGLMTVAYPKLRLPDLVVESVVRERVDRTLLEQRQRERLREHGFEPQRKLLLLGPPGTGKTMTASVVAGELALPLFTIQLDGLITKFLGETAAKLRLIFDAVRQTRAVYLFDEFDALGGERASRNDVGEIRRVLNSFLQFLEQDESDGLIVAATNHPGILDRALFRRFDAVIEYVVPTPSIAERVMRARLALLDTSGLEWSQAVAAAEGLSHADIARACEQAAKTTILQRSNRVGTAALVAAFRERRASHL